MGEYFAAFLDLRGRPCLVVGGGMVGERKTRDLLESGARVTVVSPALTSGLAGLAAAGHVVHHERRFRRWDVRGSTLVIAATGDRRVDLAVAAEARRRRALVNVVDDPAHCDFIAASVLRRGPLQIAVSTSGRSPALARDIRLGLEGLFAADFGAVVEEASRRRSMARAAMTQAPQRVAGERAASAALARK